MRCHVEIDFVRFADRALPYLQGDPVGNNIAYTLLTERRQGGLPVEPDLLMATAENDAGELTGLALRTPPYPLLLTDMSPSAARALADYLAATHPQLPGVTGPVAPAREFAMRWSAATGARVTPTEQYRLFRLLRLVPPTAIPGGLREADTDDRELLVRWSVAFSREALPAATWPDPGPAIDARLARGGALWLWEVDGRPVSTLAQSLPTAGVVRISGVYTPPQERRRGYASACAAAASQLALDRGADACVLTTDLANPTSNHIYQAIGYQAVDDTRTWRFRAGTEGQAARAAGGSESDR